MYKTTAQPNQSEIEYKTIRPEDFPDYLIKDNSYKTIIADEYGYISEFLINEVDIEHKDTTVINASVGQGKTTALIKIAKEYYSKEGYMVFIVAPAKSLLDQYLSHLKNSGIQEHDILDYRNLEFMTIDADKGKFANRKFQLMTFNFLLANSGDHFLKQADHKIDYINELLDQCTASKRKIVIIFDEVHDAIHNFKEDLVFNLFRWKNHIHKIFVSSATFNEASKVVIKYFAELTDQKIQIFESFRAQNELTINELSILIYDKAYYNFDDESLIEFFTETIDGARRVNILTATKSLSQGLINSPIGSLIKKRYGEINLCTADTENVFSEKQCNIGTTFKTGISVNEEDTVFYIFLPHRSSYNNSPPTLGIFTDGINSLIQAMARVRKKGKIYVITPNKTGEFEAPEGLFPKYNALLNLSDQDRMLKSFYNHLKTQLEPEISYLDGSKTKISARFPNYDQFKLSKGEKFFRTYFDIFGRNMTNYFNWASSNNQFVNCRLKYVYRIDLKLEEEKLLEGLTEYYSKTFGVDPGFAYLSPLEQYKTLRKSIFSNHVIIKSKGVTGKISEVKEYQKPTLEKNIIKLIQILNHFAPNLEDDLGKNHVTIDYILDDKESLRWLEPFKIHAVKKYLKVREKGYVMTTEEYIRNAMYWSTNISLKKGIINSKENLLIDLYSKLSLFRDVFKGYFIKNSKHLIIPNDNAFEFNESDYTKLTLLFKEILQNDEILQKVFNPFSKGITHKTLFSLLKKVFFKIRRTNINGNKESIFNGDQDGEAISINLIYPEMDFLTALKELPPYYTYPED